jgi:hypothetical protein
MSMSPSFVTAMHGTAEELLELAAHGEGIFPVVGRPPLSLEREQEGAVFYAGDEIHLAGRKRFGVALNHEVVR